MRMRLIVPSQRGSTLIEGLLAIVVFSVGLIGLLMLLAATLVDSANAHYRSQASLLASELVAQMWTGDRSLPALQLRFGDANAAEYRNWRQRVEATLPGVSAATNLPQVSIDAQRDVTITLAWRVPGEAGPHQLVVHTRVAD